ncbi:MAG: hypothetical protein ABW190_17520 [Rhizobacter sp.]
MSAVRLEFELDSEVYPELHAALASLRNPRARSERLRQLAAAGLVWEKVRLHGATAVPAAVPAVEERTDLVTRADVSAEPPSQAMPLPALERRASPAKRARAEKVREAPADDPEFVDLAINAEPTPVPPVRPERSRSRPTRRDLEQVIRELPVLMDVVAVDEAAAVNVLPDVHAPNDDADDDIRATAYDEPLPSWASTNAYPDDVPPAHADTNEGAGDTTDDDTLDMTAATLHVTALSHKPATRSRLMRMKERGLFKNG